MNPDTPNRTGRKRGIFVKNQWMCECNPRIAAVSQRVSRETENKGRQFWGCVRGQERGCGFFLWNDEAKIRESEAVLVSGKPPAAVATPSRRLQQTKISDSLRSAAQKKAVATTSTSLVEPEVSTSAAPPNNDGANSRVLQANQVLASLSDSEGEATGEDGYQHSRYFDTPRKSARTEQNTSPSKRELEMQTMAGRGTFINRGSNSHFVETPSSKFSQLALKTPMTNARIQAERRFDAITPIKRPNFGGTISTTNSSVKSSDSGNPFASASKENRPIGNDGRPMARKEEVIDIEKLTFDFLESVDVHLEDIHRSTLSSILRSGMTQSAQFLKGRDLVRAARTKLQSELEQKTKENEDLKEQLKERNDKYIELNEHRDAEKCTLQDQHKELKALQKERQDLKSRLYELEDMEAENKQLKERLASYEDDLGF